MTKTMNKWVMGFLAVLTLALVGTLLLLMPVGGAEDDYEEASLESIEEAILADNLSIKNAKEVLMIENYKKDKVEAKKGTGTTSINVALSNEYSPVEAKMNVDYAALSLGRLERDLVLEGKKAYFTHNLLIDEIALLNGKIARLEDTLKTMKLKVELGTATISKVQSIELDIAKASSELQGLQNKKEQQYLALNKLVGYDLDTKLVLDETAIPFEAYKVESIGATVNSALNNNEDLLKLGTQGELYSTDLDIRGRYNGDGKQDDTILSLKEKISENNMAVKEKELDIEYGVRSDYNSLLNTYDSFRIKALELENLEMALNVTQKRFDVGLEVEATLALAKENIAYAQLALEQAKLDYYVAVESFKNMVQ